MFDWFDSNRRWLKNGLKKAEKGAFRDYLLAGMPDIKASVEQAEFVVLDFETTGLNVEKDHIISVGYTEIKQGRVLLGKSRHYLVMTSHKLQSHSVKFHHLTDDMIENGLSIATVLSDLLLAMAGKVVVVHHKKIEYGFLQKACVNLYQSHLPIIMLDTLMIEKKYRDRLNRPYHNHDLRLFNLRKAYHLPHYRAHNAMEDAIATAELFIAQFRSRQSSIKNMRIKDLM